MAFDYALRGPFNNLRLSRLSTPRNLCIGTTIFISTSTVFFISFSLLNHTILTLSIIRRTFLFHASFNWQLWQTLRNSLPNTISYITIRVSINYIEISGVRGMFSVGDRIVHPMHGAGIIIEIINREVDNVPTFYYTLQLTLDEVVLFIPVDNSEEIGLRSICSRHDAARLLEYLSTIELDADQSWNRRYRENMLRIRSGDAEEVAKVVRNLMQRNAERGLSTGEKKMFGSAKRILISELALSLEKKPNEIEETLNTRLCL